MEETTQTTGGYNSCFVLGGKTRLEDDKLIKLPVYINKNGFLARLSGGKGGEMQSWYALSYEDACKKLEKYRRSGKISRNISDPRVSLYLDKAMYNDLYLFVIDFDQYDEESAFFKGARALADKTTRSQGGGWHMFFGVDKDTATPLFDSINLLASNTAKSYISHTGAESLDGGNKVDFFCDAMRFIYEWEAWDNTAGLTDCTQELYGLIREHFALRRPHSVSGARTAGGAVLRRLEKADEQALLERMSDTQKKIFKNLMEEISSDTCGNRVWFRVGLDIWHVFGDELGGEVFRFWSAPGHSFNEQGCALTWANICRAGPQSQLINRAWRALLEEEQAP